jgi:mRNA interferase RelE/StbE
MTRAYGVIIPNSVRRTLEALEDTLRSRIIERLDALATNPRPRGVVKMAGQHGTFRLRVGDWRIVYEVRDVELVVLLVKIGHRREVYR